MTLGKVRPRKRTIPKKSRTIPMRGKNEDEGKYFHCWVCGFVNDVRVNELGGPSSESGDNHTEYYTASLGSLDHSFANGAVIVLEDPIHNFHVVFEEDGLGNAKNPYHDFTTDVTAGCSLCGSTNWRGDYP